jgi:hypothetical protein
MHGIAPISSDNSSVCPRRPTDRLRLQGYTG